MWSRVFSIFHSIDDDWVSISIFSFTIFHLQFLTCKNFTYEKLLRHCITSHIWIILIANDKTNLFWKIVIVAPKTFRVVLQLRLLFEIFFSVFVSGEIYKSNRIESDRNSKFQNKCLFVFLLLLTVFFHFTFWFSFFFKMSGHVEKVSINNFFSLFASFRNPFGCLMFEAILSVQRSFFLWLWSHDRQW